MDFDPAELQLMTEFKVAHGRAWAGELIIEQGQGTPRLLTIFSGFAARFRAIPSGQRQLISVALPGDLVGLQSVLCSESAHSIVALTDVTYCVLDAGKLKEILRSSLGYRFAWLQALNQRHAEERLTTVGAYDGFRSLGAFVHDLFHRLKRRQRIPNQSFRLPLTQQQLAEALGLTPVHVKRLLLEFEKSGILKLERGKLTILDLAQLEELACASKDKDEARPLI